MVTEENKKNNEAQIKSVIEKLAESVRTRDIESLMSVYAPELVSFDVVPPLQYKGTDSFRKVWEEMFSMYQGPISYDSRELSITAGDDIALLHSIDRISGTLPTGESLGPWVRWTACLQKINGQWLIVHHQNSVPADFETGRAVFDLVP